MTDATSALLDPLTPRPRHASALADDAREYASRHGGGVCVATSRRGLPRDAQFYQISATASPSCRYYAPATRRSSSREDRLRMRIGIAYNLGTRSPSARRPVDHAEEFDSPPRSTRSPACSPTPAHGRSPRLCRDFLQRMLRGPRPRLQHRDLPGAAQAQAAVCEMLGSLTGSTADARAGRWTRPRSASSSLHRAVLSPHGPARGARPRGPRLSADRQTRLEGRARGAAGLR